MLRLHLVETSGNFSPYTLTLPGEDENPSHKITDKTYQKSTKSLYLVTCHSMNNYPILMTNIR